MTLPVGGQISGTVTNASITHPGLAKVEVCALKPYKYEETEYFGRVRCGYTNTSGQYTISGLENGSYKVEFNGYICSIPKKGEEECPEVYMTEYYHGQQTAKKGGIGLGHGRLEHRRDQRKPARSVPDDAGQHRRADADGDGGRRPGAELLAGLLVA